MDLLRYIRLGIQHREIFSYDDFSVTLRPLTSSELDDATLKALYIVDSRLVVTLVNIRLGIYRADERLKDIPPELMINLKKYKDEIDYYITFYAMKDFMPPEFTLEDVRKMHHVHEIATKVLSMSIVPKDTLIKEIRTKDGQKLATIIHEFHIPLANEAWKLTELQYEFTYYTSGKAPIQCQSVDEIDQVLEGMLNRVR
jgi:hypothetical protein